MKKFLAVLLALAMVMTLVPTMAFADAQTFEAVEMTYTGTDKRLQYTIDKDGEVIKYTTGQVIEVILTIPTINGVETNSVRIRDAAEGSKTDIHKLPLTDERIAAYENAGDWYKITATVTGDGAGLLFTFYFDNLDAAPTGEKSYVYSIVVKDKDANVVAEYDAAAIADMGIKGSDAELVELEGDYEFLPEPVVPTFGAVEMTYTGTDKRLQYTIDKDSEVIKYTTGQVIEVILTIPTINGVETNSVRIRDAAEGSKTDIHKLPLTDERIAAYENAGDWYKITATVTGDGAGLLFTFYFDNLDAAPTGEKSYVYSIVVKDKDANVVAEYDAAAIADMGIKGSDAELVELEGDYEFVSEPESDKTEDVTGGTESDKTEDVTGGTESDKTEDVTGGTESDKTEDPEDTADVEPTGAISIAVVAVAAVIGGAVVLKKREF